MESIDYTTVAFPFYRAIKGNIKNWKTPHPYFGPYGIASRWRYLVETTVNRYMQPVFSRTASGALGPTRTDWYLPNPSYPPCPPWMVCLNRVKSSRLRSKLVSPYLHPHIWRTRVCATLPCMSHRGTNDGVVTHGSPTPWRAYHDLPTQQTARSFAKNGSVDSPLRRSYALRVHINM